MRISLPAVALLVGVTLAGFGGSSPSTPSERPTAGVGRYSSLHLAVCEAASAAGAGDEVGASAAFDDVHGPLHDLAAATGAKDRAVAARLLEAKQAVEAEADADDYEALVGAVDAAIATIGDEVGKCPE